MKTCKGCVYADWHLTKSSRLHPSGDGECKFKYKVPALPAAFYWMGTKPPKPCGGFINRKEELKNHCPYYQAGKAQC